MTRAAQPASAPGSREAGPLPASRRRRLRCERGQALVELVAGLPLVVAVGLILLQLLAAGYSVVLAGNAAEAGALALAGGGDARAAVRHALPGWSDAGARVEVGDDSVRVVLRPPSPIRAVSRKLEVTADAAVEIE